MGKLRFYTCGKYGLIDVTNNALSTNGTTRIFSVNWKDTGGNNYTTLRPYRENSIFYGNLYATTETEQTFDESNYSYTEVSGVTLTDNRSGDAVNVSDGKVYRTASITLTNTGETTATVPSVTSTNSFSYSTNSSSSYSKTALSWCYIFDTPITLNAGETKTVVFNFGYTLPTNDD